ncbi:cytochrome c oxidase accessory protein CcoG [Oceanospirillum sanctuarii]|uniref:cytochrome c oxidase accessory protein CcoG n=1 Tax=Oceanospirillum sanctuarii TaxID=1434821 RepID=UPI000A3940A2|nr:cytochrome c oxidase accessory protein CcoG [Oceanospirillum sanctuarii]
MKDRIPTQDITDAAKKRAHAVKSANERKIEKKDEGENLYQKRKHIYVRRAIGFFTNLRTSINWVFLLAYFSFSWLQWDGKQAIFFDLPNRQFHVFGFTFFPHDFMLLSWALIIAAFLLFFMTVFAGRVWCGYACPQSVWTFFYIWAERVTEGSRNQRVSLDKAPMSGNKFVRKAAKHAIWLVIALATAFAFVGYFSPVRDLGPRILAGELGPWETWWLVFFTVATYVNAGWMREQVCMYMCPYARFQSVMFDRDTLVVSYDEQRGEGRGPRKKGDDTYKERGLGDCIDCGVCVQVCPVGIDIRDGLQYECITCAACIDGCNEMMEKMGYERGLVRYTTENELEGKKTHIMRPRLIGYFVALMAMMIAFAFAVTDRIPLELEVLRDRNQLYRMDAEGNVENSFIIKLANMDQVTRSYELSVKGLKGLELVGTKEVSVSAGEVINLPVRMKISRDDMSVPSADIEVTVKSIDGSNYELTKESRFIGAVQR